MGAWYRVVKTIKGRRYAYLQRTWRKGKTVHTENRYLGPVDGAGASADVPGKGGAGEGKGRADRQPRPVITTSAPERPALPLDEAFTSLLAPITSPPSWGLPWDEGRIGRSRVRSVDELDDLLEKLGFYFTSRNEGAFYSPDEDTINIPPKRKFRDTDFETATQAYYATFLHELAHWTGHSTRLNRLKFEDFFVTSKYAREELVAEATATILMRYFKIAPANPTNHANYFQNWLMRAGDREEALEYARTEAERAVRLILSSVTTT